MSAPSCIFCRIVAGEIPATIVAESPMSLAFRDLDPVAPTHVLVLPREHHDTLVELAAASAEQLDDLVTLAGTVAQQEGLERGYRIVTNAGSEGGQTVHHVHLHVLGGRQLEWPPG